MPFDAIFDAYAELPPPHTTMPLMRHCRRATPAMSGERRRAMRVQRAQRDEVTLCAAQAIRRAMVPSVMSVMRQLREQQ